MLSLVTWNIQFRRLNSADGRNLREAIEACQPEIVCVTEGHPDFLDLPHRIESAADYGYPMIGGRRKVLLWSRQPWLDVDAHGDPAMPPGRYVAGRTRTSIGDVTVHGVCIPWRSAHVSSGRRNCQPWDEHLAYLDGLKRAMGRVERNSPTLVVGDYNQHNPRRSAPRLVSQALADSFPSHFRCATEGLIEPIGRASIDHIHYSEAFDLDSCRSLSNVEPDGRRLSDHFGLHLQMLAAPRDLATEANVPIA